MKLGTVLHSLARDWGSNPRYRIGKNRCAANYTTPTTQENFLLGA